MISTFICLCGSILFSQAVKAVPGCRSSSGFYYHLVSSPPDNIYEYYTAESALISNTALDCNSPVNQNSTYVLTKDLSFRTPKGSRCFITSTTGYVQGTGYAFAKIYQCPIDDYIPFVLVLMLPVSFLFSRQRILSAVIKG